MSAWSTPASTRSPIARAHPDRQVVFFAIGFETTTPPTAVALRQAKALGLTNFSVHCNHVLTPPAIMALLDSPEARDGKALPLDGFVGPAHVSAVIGSRPFEPFTERHRRPVVIAGFEPLDVMQAILMLIRQLNDGRAEVENEYTRVVTRDGNLKAQALMAEVFELRDSFEWRGSGRTAVERAAHPRELRRLRRRAALLAHEGDRGRQQGLRVPVDPARPEAADRLPASSPPSARRKTRSARAWSPRKGRAPPTTPTAAPANAGARRPERQDHGQARRIPVRSTCAAGGST